jgi:hypothetical protein
MAEATVAEKRALAILNKLWGEAGVGAQIRKTSKELFPEVTLPEDEVEPVLAPMRAQLEEQKAKNADLEGRLQKIIDERATSDAEKSFEAQMQAASKRFNLTDEGRAKVIARMKETGNYTAVEDAAAYIVSQMPAPKASNSASWLPQPMDMFGSKNHDEKFEKLHRDPIGYQDAELREFISDPDKYVRDTFGAAA